MSEADGTITCANCGKAFKASPGSKKFHCASCHETTMVEHQNNGGSGKILCGNCWSSMELREELYKTSQGLLGEMGAAGPADEKLVQANRELEERLAELQARLSLAEEGRGAALRERDISTDSRSKLEKTLAELLGKFASVREAEMNAVKDRDAAREQCRTLERRVKDAGEQLVLSQETEAAAMSERNNAATARAELEAKADGLQRQLSTAQDALAQERSAMRASQDGRIMELESHVAKARESESKLAEERTAALKAKTELELKHNDLNARLNALQEQLQKAQNESSAAELENRAGELHGELVAAQFENMQICAERDMALTARTELEAKIADLNERLSKAHAAQVQAAKERDEALAAKPAGDSGDTSALRAELNRLREAAVTALEPLGMECSTKMKDLMAETENVLSEARLARDKAHEHYETLDKMLGSLRGNINLARRHVTGRLSMVLGIPAGESGMSPALKASISTAQNKSVGSKSGTMPSAPVAAAGE